MCGESPTDPGSTGTNDTTERGTLTMTTGQRSKLQHAVQAWKTKALRRGQQLKQANKRVRELTQSRDQWKQKAQVISIT
jgi:hypothetical protein